MILLRRVIPIFSLVGVLLIISSNLEFLDVEFSRMNWLRCSEILKGYCNRSSAHLIRTKSFPRFTLWPGVAGGLVRRQR